MTDLVSFQNGGNFSHVQSSSRGAGVPGAQSDVTFGGQGEQLFMSGSDKAPRQTDLISVDALILLAIVQC